MSASPPAAEQLLPLHEVQAVVKLYSARQILRMEASGSFPSRRVVGPRKHAWLLSDVINWMRGLPRARQETIKPAL